jgi:hypothetical protein
MSSAEVFVVSTEGFLKIQNKDTRRCHWRIEIVGQTAIISEAGPGRLQAGGVGSLMPFRATSVAKLFDRKGHLSTDRDQSFAAIGATRRPETLPGPLVARHVTFPPHVF